MEGVTFLGVESAQEHNGLYKQMLDYEFYHYLTVDAQQTVSLPAIDQPDDGILTSSALYFNVLHADGTDEAKIPLLTTSNDKENKPVTDANEDEWPLALQGNDYNITLYSKYLFAVQRIHAHYTYNTASPQSKTRLIL